MHFPSLQIDSKSTRSLVFQHSQHQQTKRGVEALRPSLGDFPGLPAHSQQVGVPCSSGRSSPPELVDMENLGKHHDDPWCIAGKSWHVFGHGKSLPWYLDNLPSYKPHLFVGFPSLPCEKILEGKCMSQNCVRCYHVLHVWVCLR